jgi:hypothetical protein
MHCESPGCNATKQNRPSGLSMAFCATRRQLGQLDGKSCY